MMAWLARMFGVRVVPYHEGKKLVDEYRLAHMRNEVANLVRMSRKGTNMEVTMTSGDLTEVIEVRIR